MPKTNIAKTTVTASAPVTTRKKTQNLLAIKIVIGLIGLFLSIFLHEMFHVLMHLDQVPHIGLFPSHSGALVEILVNLPQGYDLEGEEIVAYAITLLVMLITVMIIFKIHDSTDNRTSAEILFPNNKDMQKLSAAELLKLVDRADIAEVHHTVEADRNNPAPKQANPQKSSPTKKASKNSTKQAKGKAA